METLGEELYTNKVVVWRLFLRLPVSILSIGQPFQMQKILHIHLQMRLSIFARYLCQTSVYKHQTKYTHRSKTITQICKNVSQSSFIYNN